MGGLVGASFADSLSFVVTLVRRTLPGFASLPGFVLPLRSLRLGLFDDQRAGGSAEQLGLAVAVNVGMVPVQAGWLGGGDAELIFEGGSAG